MLYLCDCDRFLGIVNLKEIWCNCALGFTLHLPCGHAQPPHLFCGLCGPVQETRLTILDLDRLPPYPPLAMLSHLPCSPIWYAAGGCSKPARRAQCTTWAHHHRISLKNHTPCPPPLHPLSGVGVQVFSLEIKQVMPGMAHNTWMNGEPFLGYSSNSFHALRPTIQTDTSIQTGVTSGLPECLWPDGCRE